MKLLSGLLTRYQHIKPPQKALREAFIAAVYQEAGIELTDDQVDVQGKNVRLKAPSVIKNEVRLHQQAILKRVADEVGNANALTTIF